MSLLAHYWMNLSLDLGRLMMMSQTRFLMVQLLSCNDVLMGMLINALMRNKAE